MTFENYFNYFTEVENCFRRQRGTPSLISPVDWALVESWKDAGIPLAAVCEGIERTFEKRARRPRRSARVNGLAFCAQEVLRAAERAATAAVESGAPPGNGARAAADSQPFDPGHIAAFLHSCAAALNLAAEQCRAGDESSLDADFDGAGRALQETAAKEQLLSDPEALERVLSIVEERLFTSLARGAPLEAMAQIQEDVDRGLAACRRSMSSAQIESVSRQFLKKRLFEHYRLPRISLFYM